MSAYTYNINICKFNTILIYLNIKIDNELILNQCFQNLHYYYLIALWLPQETLFKPNRGGIQAGIKKYGAV